MPSEVGRASTSSVRDSMTSIATHSGGNAGRPAAERRPIAHVHPVEPAVRGRRSSNPLQHHLMASALSEDVAAATTIQVVTQRSNRPGDPRQRPDALDDAQGAY